MYRKTVFILIALAMFAAVLTACSGSGMITATSSAVNTVPSETASSTADNAKAIDVAWKCTTQDNEWQDKAPVKMVSGAAGKADISIDTSKLLQKVDGFGGAFNEKGWVALSVLSPEERNTVMAAMFDQKDGAKFNICRVPIGASDYAVSRYTLDETKDDYDMKGFSIDRDKEKLIPYIKAAMEYDPDLKIWGSAWTPPTWMKTNGDFDGGNMKDDSAVYQAYALYLERFVKAYQAEGINLFAVAVQNEPTINTHYPSCLWAPRQVGIFIKDHLGPLFENDKVNAEIMLGTIQDGDFSRYPALLGQPDVRKYVSLTGFQWSGTSSVAQTRSLYPDLKIYQTETECGNFYWKDGYDPNKPQNDWAYGIYTWNKVKEYFDEGVNAYLLWNMVLDEEGKSIDSQSPWPQDSAITINKTTKEITYTPMFYAFKHISYYVQPGASYLDLGKAKDAMAFLNPDGSIVIELQNENAEQSSVNISVGGRSLTVNLPAMSWNTLVVPKL